MSGGMWTGDAALLVQLFISVHSECLSPTLSSLSIWSSHLSTLSLCCHDTCFYHHAAAAVPSPGSMLLLLPISTCYRLLPVTATRLPPCLHQLSNLYRNHSSAFVNLVLSSLFGPKVISIQSLTIFKSANLTLFPID